MAKGGRGNRAVDNLTPELRAQVDALLDMGKDIAEVYESFPAVQAAMSYESLRAYAAQRRRDRQLSIIADARALLDGILDVMEVDRSSLSTIDQVAIATALKAMLAGDGTPDTINGLRGLLNIRKDRRKEAEHELKMVLGRMKADLEKAARTDTETGEKVVDLATVARLMREVDMAD